MSRAPFDPGDGFDAMAESFRRQTSDMMVEALDAAIFRDLPGDQKVQAFLAGVTTGMIGVCFAHIREDGRDEMMRFIFEYLPLAQEQAAGILDRTASAEESQTC